MTAIGSGKEPDSLEWGPIMWKYLHCLSEKIGQSGNSIVDTDQANYMEFLLSHLPSVIPCTECQDHASNYITKNPLPTLKGLYGSSLKNTVRMWLMNFHNEVRARKGQPIMLDNLDTYSMVYAECFVPKCEYSVLTESISFAVRQGWIKVDAWKKWYNFSERMRILTGGIIV
jgi:hypothetical protein